MKKGFTIMEIMVAVFIIGYIIYQALPFQQASDFRQSVEDATKDFENIVNVTIFNPYTGYATDTGGNCSSSFDVANITAQKIKDCSNSNLLQTTLTGTYDPTIPEDSYFTLLPTNGEGCKIFVKNTDSFTVRFLFDCSKLAYGDKKYVEEVFIAGAKRKLSSVFNSSEMLSTSLDNDPDGALNNDGIFTIDLKK